MSKPSETVTQCKSCPWRVGCVPDRDIPNGYSRAIHEGLSRTIAKPAGPMLSSDLRAMACHYSKPGEEFACAGWLHNQIGAGNNLGVRLQVIRGGLPSPIVDGEQYARFEDTLPKPTRRTQARRPR